jgi:hypothetical protein
MTATVRLAAGFGLLYAGFHMVAVMAPPDPGGWSLAAIACLCLGAGIAGHAALDLMGVE